MPMRSQPGGVHRTRRDEGKPPREYDIFVDGEPAGHVERCEGSALGYAWRAYRPGAWPQKFTGGGAYLAAVQWMATAHRAAKATAEQVTAVEASGVQVLSPAVADPFRGDLWADPLA